MQWVLAFLEPPTRVQKTISLEPNTSARVEALNILARLIAQAVTTIKQTESTDE
ncbi:MAG TPA: hypothetical protein VNO18_22200 [Xanthobacteraceae bacterium]|jgi:hypothetical protein|nr:hypothetical protein [Xanthobacteraceae bacterium]